METICVAKPKFLCNWSTISRTLSDYTFLQTTVRINGKTLPIPYVSNPIFEDSRILDLTSSFDLSDGEIYGFILTSARDKKGPRLGGDGFPCI